MTWRLVTMNPFGSTSTPEPSERCLIGPASWLPKNLSKKSPKGFSSSSPCPWPLGGWPGWRRALGLTVDSVLMFTTAGSSDVAICENWLEVSLRGGTVNGVASAERVSWPRTPPETTVPIRIPIVSVSRMISVDASRFALKRPHRAFACSRICHLPPIPEFSIIARELLTQRLPYVQLLRRAYRAKVLLSGRSESAPWSG